MGRKGRRLTLRKGSLSRRGIPRRHQDNRKPNLKLKDRRRIPRKPSKRKEWRRMLLSSNLRLSRSPPPRRSPNLRNSSLFKCRLKRNSPTPSPNKRNKRNSSSSSNKLRRRARRTSTTRTQRTPTPMCKHGRNTTPREGRIWRGACIL
jgi:hypothetical protein